LNRHGFSRGTACLLAVPQDKHCLQASSATQP
jgi:hypothetical protein